MGDDLLTAFHQSLLTNPTIKGLPQDYDTFKNVFTDPDYGDQFYNSLKTNPTIKGLPDTYDEFIKGLELDSMGIAPSTEPEEEQRYLGGLWKKLKAGTASMAQMPFLIPQAAEAMANVPMSLFANAMIKREEKSGAIDKETADFLREEQLYPRANFGQTLPVMPGTETIGSSIADNKVSQWLAANVKELNESVTKYDKTATEYLKNKQFGKALGVLSYEIAESLPVTMAAMLVPGGPAMLGLGVGAQKYDEIKDRKDMPELMRLADAATTGIFEWLFERFGSAEMGRYLKAYYAKSGRKGIEQAFKSTTLQNLIAKAYKKLGLWFAPVHEGISEFFTTLGQNAAIKYSGENPDIRITDNAIESFLVGTGMGGVFSSTAVMAKNVRDRIEPPMTDIGPGATSIGPLRVPRTREEAEDIINNTGRQLKFGEIALEDDPNPIISFAQTKAGQNILLKQQAGVNGDNFFIALDLETNEPLFIKSTDIKQRKDVPYQEWLENELRNYDIVEEQAGQVTSQLTAPVQEGQEITLRDKNFYVSQVTGEGVTLNEIDDEGNLTGATLQVAPDQYGSVFGGPEEVPAEVPEEVTEAPGQRKLTAEKTEYIATPNEEGILTINEVFTDETSVKNAVKALEKGYPKAAFTIEKTESEDFLTPDEYRITLQPKKAVIPSKEKPAKKEEIPTKEEKAIKPETRPLSVFSKGDLVKDSQTGEQYEVVETGKEIVKLKDKDKKIDDYRANEAIWLPIQKKIRPKGVKRKIAFGPDNRTGKVLSQTPNDFTEAVLQFFVGGSKVSTDDLILQTGYKGGTKEFNKLIGLHKKDGVSLDLLSEQLAESFGIEEKGAMASTNEILRILNDYPSKPKMLAELERRQGLPEQPEITPEEIIGEIEDATVENVGEIVPEIVDNVLDELISDEEIMSIFTSRRHETREGNIDWNLLENILDADPSYFTEGFPYTLNEEQLEKLKNLLHDTDKKTNIEKAVAGHTRFESGGEGYVIRPGAPEHEERGRRAETEKEKPAPTPGKPEVTPLIKENPEAVKYINEIRNPAKKDYALIYHDWILKGRPKGKEPQILRRDDLSPLAAQSVRLNLDDFYPKGPPGPTAQPELLPPPKEEPPAEEAEVEVKPPVKPIKPEFAGEFLEKKTKEPWEMTQGEWINYVFRPGAPGTVSKVTGKSLRRDAGLIYSEKKYHESQVRKALKENKPVPPEILKDYPELQKPTEESIFNRAKDDFEKMIATATAEDLEKAKTGAGLTAAKFAMRYTTPDKNQALYNRIYDLYFNQFTKKEVKPKEGETKYDTQDKTRLPGEVRERQKPEQAKPVKETGREETGRSRDVQTYEKQKAQVEILRKIIDNESQHSKIDAELTALESKDEGDLKKSEIKRIRQLKLARDQLLSTLASLRKQVTDIIPSGQRSEIEKLIRGFNTEKEIINNRIEDQKTQRRSKERELQARHEVFGDRKEAEEARAGLQTMFAGDLFRPESALLQNAIKPFNDAIIIAQEELARKDNLLNQKIDFILRGTQGKLGIEVLTKVPEAPEDKTPIEREENESDDKPLTERQADEEKKDFEEGISQINVLKDFGEKIGGARKDMEIKRDGTLIRKSGEPVPKWMRDWNIGKNEDGTYSPFKTAGPRGMYIIFNYKGKFRTEDEAISFIKVAEAGRKFRVQKTKDDKYEVYRKVSDRKRHTIQGGFETEKDALMWMIKNVDFLIDFKPEFPERPHIENLERTGPERIKGNVTTQQFQDTFGFTGGEFGNWVPQDERQRILNMAYNGLWDLADIIGVPPRALSLNGQLSIAFGARGQGLVKAEAHYERQRAVFNLTRMKGAGSIAHEWFHALDHYLGAQDKGLTLAKDEKGIVNTVKGRDQDYLSHGYSIRSHAREELTDAFKNVIATIFKQPKIVEVSIKRFSERVKARQEDLDYKIKELRDYLTSERNYGLKKAAATPDQEKLLNKLIEKVINNDLGAPVKIETQNKWINAIDTTQTFKQLNDLFKDITGRSAYKYSEGRKVGRIAELEYTVKSLNEVKTSLEKYRLDNKEERLTPTKFYYDAKDIDSMRATDYWTTEHEMAARAFESYVESKLEEKGQLSQYLVHSTKNSFYKLFSLNPYPEGIEKERIDAAFDKLFDILETRAEGGQVAMFRISDALYFSPTEKALDAVKQDKATPQQWKAMLLKNGAKEPELAWMGWDDLVAEKKSLNKVDIQSWIDQNKIRIEDVTLGGGAEKGTYTLWQDLPEDARHILERNAGNLSEADITELRNMGYETRYEGGAIDPYIYKIGAKPTRYEQYTLPGGENYTELLLTLPTQEKFKPWIAFNPANPKEEVVYFDTADSAEKYAMEKQGWDYAPTPSKERFDENVFTTAHWEEPNVLAHVRFNTRRTPEGKNILFIEEIQSDWAQKGKREGFVDPRELQKDKDRLLKRQEELKQELNDLIEKGYAMGLPKGASSTEFLSFREKNPSWSDEYSRIKREEDEIYKELNWLPNKKLLVSGVPNMPFKSTEQWAGFALRRMIRYAIDNGFDSVAWTTGEVQNERYNLSNYVESILYAKNGDLLAVKKGQDTYTTIALDIKEDKLPDYIGKEATERLLIQKPNPAGDKVLKETDLKIGGKGMLAFYDQILPSIANKIGKKFGMQVKTEEINVEEKGIMWDYRSDGIVEVFTQEGGLIETFATKEDAEEFIKKGITTKVHSLSISEAMFNSYRQGIPLFRDVKKLTGEELLGEITGITSSKIWEKNIKNKITDLAESFNTPVKIINNRNELPVRLQRQAKRKGYGNKLIPGVWDPQSESVYVLIDDIRNMGIERGVEEVTKTILHEVVAHKGLPYMLGRDVYNNLLDDLYWDIPADERHSLMMDYNTTDKRVISEEYLGLMAEENVNPNLFQKILARIRQIIRKLFKVTYSKNDIHNLLRRSRENLRKPKAKTYEFAEEYLKEEGKLKEAEFRVKKLVKEDLLEKAGEVYAYTEAGREFKESLKGLRQYFQDINLPVRDFEEEVLKRGGKQDNESKPYRDTSLSFGRQEKLYNDFFNDKMKPVLGAVANIKNADMPGENILPYIICKHAIERNQHMREREKEEWMNRNPDASQKDINDLDEALKNKDYSGVMPFNPGYENPDKLAGDIVKEFESRLDKKLIDDLWTKMRVATSSILDTWLAGQQISEEQKNEYLERFKYYVPLRGWREGAAKELVYTKGEGFRKSLRYAEGRKSLAENPLSYILNVEFQAISEQVDNEVKTSMLNLIVRNLGNNEIHELATIKKLYYVKIDLPDGSHEWEPTINRPSPEMFATGYARSKIYREHERLRAPRQAREHEVIVRRPGGDMVIVFKGKNLPVGQALNKQNYMYRSVWNHIFPWTGDKKAKDARKLNQAFAGMGAINNILKATYTSWNVVFPFTNFMRDFQEASITQSIKSGTGLRVIRNYKHSFPAIVRYIMGRPNLTNNIDRELQEFYKLGGATGYTHLKTPNEIEKDINNEIKRMVRAGTLRGDIQDTAYNILRGIEYWNRVFEDATRFSVYLSSLAAGNTKEDAASDAKEASVNFNRKGKGSKAWDSWFAFFNVALQSMQKNFALAKNFPKKFSVVALSFVMGGFLEALMNAMFDDDDETSYYNINPYMRQNYLLIPNFVSIIKGEGKGNKYISIPLPQFWRGFKSMGAIAFDIATKKMSFKDGVRYALSNFGTALLPIDIAGLWMSGEFSLAPIMPTIIRPIAEVIENKNYMGYTIKNEPFTRDQKKSLTNAGLGKQNVSPAAKFITDMLFRWGGGDTKYKYYYDSRREKVRKVPWILDINPSTIEHLFKGYTGGTGATFSDLITIISQSLDPERDIDFRNAPFINRFIRKIPEAKWNIINEYYNLRDDSKETQNLVKQYWKDENYIKAIGMVEDEYLMRYVEVFKWYESALDDAKKDVDFDDVEGNYRGIDLMRQCIQNIKELKNEYGR